MRVRLVTAVCSVAVAVFAAADAGNKPLKVYGYIYSMIQTEIHSNIH